MKTKVVATALATLIAGGAAAGTAFAAGETVGQKIDDVTVPTKINADLLATTNVDGLDINVDVKGTKGVSRVENKNVLKTRQARTRHFPWAAVDPPPFSWTSIIPAACGATQRLRALSHTIS